MRYIIIAIILFFTGCNSPPLYQKKAREYLTNQKVDHDIIQRLVEIKPLNTFESEMLAEHNNVPTLHLLASNPSIPNNIIQRLVGHKNREVRWGMAMNPNCPVDILLGYRTAGKYTTMNTYLARNPRLPKQVLIDMFNNGEALGASFALNENCPEEIMSKILAGDDQLAKVWLAKNPNLSPHIFATLEKSGDPLILQYLQTNPKFDQFSSN